MSQYQLNKLLRDLSRSREIATRCQTEPSALLLNYHLDPAEVEAVKGWQIRRLFELGVNPLLLLTSSMAMGVKMRDYISALKPAKLRENHHG
jgi:hypothetical protein